MTGRTLVASGERGVVGLDRRTGKELWHYTEGVDNCNLFIATVVAHGRPPPDVLRRGRSGHERQHRAGTGRRHR